MDSETAREKSPPTYPSVMADGASTHVPNINFIGALTKLATLGALTTRAPTSYRPRSGRSRRRTRGPRRGVPRCQPGAAGEPWGQCAVSRRLLNAMSSPSSPVSDPAHLAHGPRSLPIRQPPRQRSGH